MINDPVMLTADFLHVNILSPPAGNATSACVSTSGFFEAKCGMETGVLITSFFLRYWVKLQPSFLECMSILNSFLKCTVKLHMTSLNSRQTDLRHFTHSDVTE